MTPEGRASEIVRLRASDWGTVLFRNNSGVLKDDKGRPVRFGLGNESSKINAVLKSSDYIGFLPAVITPEMVGRQVALFVAIEVKPEGTNINREWSKTSREYGQQQFINLVRHHGGLAGFATGWSDVDEILKGAR